MNKNDISVVLYTYAQCIRTYFATEHLVHAADDENDLRRLARLLEMKMTEDDWAEHSFESAQQMIIDYVKNIVIDQTDRILEKIEVVEHDPELN